MNAKAKPVTNAGLFQRLDELVQTLIQTGLQISLSHVLRSFNQKADALANEVPNSKSSFLKPYPDA